MSEPVRRLGEADLGALTRFFAAIAADAAVQAFFTPHPFDAEMARRICTRDAITEDEYFARFEGDEMIGYGMLRGWDEGYAVPAFGVCVSPGQRGKGVGHDLLAFAIELAAGKGAESVMLKVHEGNPAARALYESFGFTFNEHTPDGAQLVGRLELAERRP